MQDDLGVAARLEDRAVADELVAQLARVDEIAVVRDGDLSVRAVDQERLRVLELALAGRRVARVADGRCGRQRLERRLVERLGDLAHAARTRIRFAVGGGDAGALLAAVLERVEAEVGEVGGLGMSEDAEDAALVFEFVHPSPPAAAALAAPAAFAPDASHFYVRLPPARSTPVERGRPDLLGFGAAQSIAALRLADDARAAAADPAAGTPRSPPSPNGRDAVLAPKRRPATPTRRRAPASLQAARCPPRCRLTADAAVSNVHSASVTGQAAIRAVVRGLNHRPPRPR